MIVSDAQPLWRDGAAVLAPLLEVRGLRIESRMAGHRHTIVSGIDLHLGRGETIGLVGESGSGKTMTARSLIGPLPVGVRATGAVLYQERNLLALSEKEQAQLRGSRISLLFQDPFTTLNPLMSSVRHIEEMLRGADGRPLDAKTRRAEALRRLAEVAIGDHAIADRYPFQLSGGMRQRVGIAAALARDPEILIADEPTTALDVTTQGEILALLKAIQRARGMGLVLITHDLHVAFSMCDRIYVLYAGSLLEVGPTARVEEEPLHPYTLELLLSNPPVDRRLAELRAIPGSVPAADEVAATCAFAPRCRWVQQRCHAGKPTLTSVTEGRASACVRLAEVRVEMLKQRRAGERRALHAATARTNDALVRVDELRKVFVSPSAFHRHAAVVALAGVSLEIGRNEVVGLVGESGSGKTTLGRCLVGLETPTAGSIVIDGVPAHDYARLGGDARRRLRRTIQMIFQDPYATLNPTWTVGATLREAIRVGGAAGDDVEARLRELFERVGLPVSYAVRKPVALSGGERQRVAIARALAVRPSILVCDEPVSAVDVSVQAQILNLFRALQADLGMSFLFVTHDLAVARQVADRLYVLYGGQVVEQGPTDDVLDRPREEYTKRLVGSIPRSGGAWLEAAPRA